MMAIAANCRREMRQILRAIASGASTINEISIRISTSGNAGIYTRTTRLTAYMPPQMAAARASEPNAFTLCTDHASLFCRSLDDRAPNYKILNPKILNATIPLQLIFVQGSGARRRSGNAGARRGMRRVLHRY